MVLFLIACDDTPSKESGDAAAVVDTGGDTDADTGNDGDSGDDTEPAEGDAVALDLEVEISAHVHTVVIVRWRTEAATTGHVEFGETTAYGWSTAETASGTEHEVFLLGMPADTEVNLRVVIDQGDGAATTSNHAITTLSLPSGMPQYVASGSVADQWNFQVIPTQGTEAVVTIIDNQGRIVWYYLPEPGGNLMKAILTHDRQHVLLGHAGPQDALDTSRLEWISLDGSEVIDVPAPYFDHDLVELPNGNIGMIVVEQRTMDDGRIWSADRLVERDAEGNETTIWNAWDEIDPRGLGLEDRANWSHSNGIEYEAGEDCYYLSMKEIGSIAKISRATGETHWYLNGMLNQFDFPDGTEVGAMQHQFEVLEPGHLLIFDNGQPERGYSRAVELQLDEDELGAEQLWEYVRVPPLYVYAKGDVQRFGDGSTQVTWSTSGEIQLVDQAGMLRWQLNADLGQAMTFVQPFQSFYADE
ncbi:MAG: aryl-sulfate sulfotransferase [Deltaproteobacteria bacterium]|nr:aryl-sulfate sulfotransferase [Deltaproteobacteria bacterium]